jgi:MFS family permease
MIAISYLGSAALLVVTGILFGSGSLSATTLTIAWTIVFFLASAGSSAAYLTVSEVFPLEIRALCIALFYEVGTGLGGIIGPLLFGSLVGTGHLGAVAVGYYIGAAVMAVGGVLELAIGVEAEGKSLEDLAAPLSADDAGGEDDRVGSSANPLRGVQRRSPIPATRRSLRSPRHPRACRFLRTAHQLCR